MASTFQTSHLSRPSLETYGDAGGSGATLSSGSVSVYDVQGTGPFVVKSDGSVTYKSKTWDPGHSDYDLLLAHLADVPGNKEKMASVIGSMTVDDAVSRGQKQEQKSGGGGDATDLLPDFVKPVGPLEKWSKEPWFWPVILLTATGIVSTTAYYFYMTKHGQQAGRMAVKKAKEVAAVVRKNVSLNVATGTDHGWTARKNSGVAIALGVGAVLVVGGGVAYYVYSSNAAKAAKKAERQADREEKKGKRQALKHLEETGIQTDPDVYNPFTSSASEAELEAWRQAHPGKVAVASTSGS